MGSTGQKQIQGGFEMLGRMQSVEIQRLKQILAVFVWPVVQNNGWILKVAGHARDQIFLKLNQMRAWPAPTL